MITDVKSQESSKASTPEARGLDERHPPLLRTELPEVNFESRTALKCSDVRLLTLKTFRRVPERVEPRCEIPNEVDLISWNQPLAQRHQVQPLPRGEIGLPGREIAEAVVEVEPIDVDVGSNHGRNVRVDPRLEGPTRYWLT